MKHRGRCLQALQLSEKTVHPLIVDRINLSSCGKAQTDEKYRGQKT